MLTQPPWAILLVPGWVFAVSVYFLIVNLRHPAITG